MHEASVHQVTYWPIGYPDLEKYQRITTSILVFNAIQSHSLWWSLAWCICIKKYGYTSLLWHRVKNMQKQIPARSGQTGNTSEIIKHLIKHGGEKTASNTLFGVSITLRLLVFYSLSKYPGLSAAHRWDKWSERERVCHSSKLLYQKKKDWKWHLISRIQSQFISLQWELCFHQRSSITNPLQLGKNRQRKIATDLYLKVTSPERSMMTWWECLDERRSRWSVTGT